MHTTFEIPSISNVFASHLRALPMRPIKLHILVPEESLENTWTKHILLQERDTHSDFTHYGSSGNTQKHACTFMRYKTAFYSAYIVIEKRGDG